MSDVAKKALPPGSWPGSKTGRTADDTSEAGHDGRSAPRSAVAPSVSKEGGKGSTTGDDRFEDVQSAHYTHERENPLQDIKEESSTNLKHVEPQPMSNGFTEADAQTNGHDADEHLPATEDGGEELEKAEDAEIPEQEYAGSKSELTESAKHAFDLASQNEPTDEARDDFLKTATSVASKPSQQADGVDDQTLGPQDSITENAGEDVDELPTELQEQQGTDLPEEVPESQQGQEVPGSQLEEGGEVAATQPEEGAEVPATELPEGAEVAETQIEGAEVPETQAEGAEVPESQLEEGVAVPDSQLGDAEVPATELQEKPMSQIEGLDPDQLPGTSQFPLTLAALLNGTVNKGLNVINEDGKLVGRVVEGEPSQVIGKKVGDDGAIWNDKGQQVGRAEPITEKEREEMLKQSSPFESFLDNTIDADGMVVSGGEFVGKVIEGDIKQLRGKSCDAEGDVIDKAGNVIGRCERWEPEPEDEPEPEPEADLSALEGGTVTSKGYILKDGRVVGRVVEGILANLVNKRCGEAGQIYSDAGKVIGRAELIPDNERDELEKDSGPFSSFPDAVVGADGWITNGPEGDVIGKVVEGDAKALRNKSVEANGQIEDNVGRPLGRAERWEPEAEPEPEATDYSILAGKRVNKAGWLVDGSGTIYGRVVEGDVKALVGRMCNKNGQILSESGDVIGRAELVSEGEREGLKEGPFAELSGLTVARDGTIVTPSGDIVGRLTEGDGKKLFGRTVDADGDVLDRNGNVLGRAERWEPEEVEKPKNALAGRRVNKKGEVYDADGNLVGQLTSGNLQACSGKEIDDDGDVVDGKGTVIGHVSLLEDIPDEEIESEEVQAKREQAEGDKKLAIQMAVCIEQCLDKIRPICKLITEKLDWADRKRENDEEVDEDSLVREIKPLIEEGGRILQEAKGIIKGLDPDGRISANAKHKTAAREATPEEYRLADLLKDLTGEVTTTIENAKKRLEDYPHAKKELNPLWGLLNEPLFQILAAVGLLLNGVLSLVGRLLSGLGLGGLIDGLLGTLGLNRVLEGLGLGGVTEGLTGGKKKKSGGGGLLGGLLGGGK